MLLVTHELSTVCLYFVGLHETVQLLRVTYINLRVYSASLHITVHFLHLTNMSLRVYFVSLRVTVHPLCVTNMSQCVYFVNLCVKYRTLHVTVRLLRITNTSLRVMNIDLGVRQHRTTRDSLKLVVAFVCKLLVCSMVKIKKSSNEFNRFLSRVCISLGHAASFTSLDKLYLMVKNHFPTVMRKEMRK